MSTQTVEHSQSQPEADRFHALAERARIEAEWVALDGTDSELASAIDKRLHVEQASYKAGIIVDAYTTNPEGYFIGDLPDPDEIFKAERSKLKPDESGNFTPDVLALFENERQLLKEKILAVLQGNTGEMNTSDIELYQKMAASQLEAAWSSNK